MEPDSYASKLNLSKTGCRRNRKQWIGAQVCRIRVRADSCESDTVDTSCSTSFLGQQVPSRIIRMDAGIPWTEQWHFFQRPRSADNRVSHALVASLQYASAVPSRCCCKNRSSTLLQWFLLHDELARCFQSRPSSSSQIAREENASFSREKS